MYCKFCGQKIDDDDSFCKHCGGKQTAAQPAQQVVNVYTTQEPDYIHKSKWTAFCLCLFLGWAGFHRFYTGKVFTGIIWLLTVGFFGIGWVLDLIVILCGGFHDKAGQPLV